MPADGWARWRESLNEDPALDSVPIYPCRILKEVRELLPEDAIVVTGAGWSKNGLAQQFQVTLPQTHFSPGRLRRHGVRAGRGDRGEEGGAGLAEYGYEEHARRCLQAAKHDFDHSQHPLAA